MVHINYCFNEFSNHATKYVLEQFKDMKRWKKKHEYGMRWIAESAFSSIKRTFGEYVSSIKWNNIVNELLLKAYIYNMFVDKTAV